MLDAVEQLDAAAPPYGIAVGVWARSVDATRVLDELAGDDDASSSDIIGAAQSLRALVRPYVA